MTIVRHKADPAVHTVAARYSRAAPVTSMKAATRAHPELAVAGADFD